MIRFADCELRLHARELWRGGKLQKLTKQAFDLLLYLIQRSPAAASYAEIARAVWMRDDVRANVIAQAMLQLRRAMGDDPDEPELIQSVRGVGYRFTAQLHIGADTPREPHETDDLATVRTTVEQAQAAAERSDFEAALMLSENAIVLSERVGANVLMARAMAIASWSSVHVGTLELASRYAFKALRIAEAEDHPNIAAFARLRAASVLSFAGDSLGALELLDGHRAPLDGSAEDATLLGWQLLAGRICTRLRRFDEGREWFERAVKTSLRLNPAGLATKERTDLVCLHVEEGTAAETSRQLAHAQRAFAKALALNAALAHDCLEIGDRVDRICWYGNQGIALCGLGRLEESKEAARKAAEMLESWPDKASPWYAWHTTEFAIQWANVLHKSGENVGAIERVQAAVASAEGAGRVDQVVQLSLIGSSASEAIGDYRSAMQWARRAQEAQQKQGLERMGKLASVYQASKGHDETVRELLAARSALALAHEQLEQLRAQIRNPVPHGAAFDIAMQRAPFEFELKQRYVDARARDLPCLVAIVQIDPGRDSTGPDTAIVRQSALLAAAVKIRLHLGHDSTRVCLWSDATLAATIQGVGLRRAQAVCEELSLTLNDTPLPNKLAEPGCTFKLHLQDLGASDSFEAALKAMPT